MSERVKGADFLNKHHIYDRVYLIGVDGAGRFFTEAETPNIDRIFSDGAYNHHVITADPTISAQCWGSILHGVTPQAHRFTNGLVGDFPVPEDHPYASVFKAARAVYPDAVLASVANWNPINTGIIEQGLGVITDTGEDDEVCEKVCKIIKENDPKLFFVQLDSVDGAGHRYGYGTQGHLDQITYTDELIGKIYDTAANEGKLDNTLFLVTADHGGTPGGDHGGRTDAELFVSFFAAGSSVNKGQFGEMESRDAASVVAFALGIDQPDNWSGRIPDGLFADGISFERASENAPDGSKRYSDRKNLPTPAENGKKLSDYIDITTLRCHFPFDGSSDDKSGKCASSVNGKIYFTEGFYGCAATLDDCTIELGNVDTDTDNYTFCAWIKKNADGDEKKRLLFTTMENENDTGISFSLRDDEMISEIGLGDKIITYRRDLPGNYDGNWFHFICSYDRNANELCYYYDFTIYSDWYSDIPVPKDLKLNGHKVRIGDRTPITVDDIMVFDHKLSDMEIDSLQKYYEQT